MKRLLTLNNLNNLKINNSITYNNKTNPNKLFLYWVGKDYKLITI